MNIPLIKIAGTLVLVATLVSAQTSPTPQSAEDLVPGQAFGSGISLLPTSGSASVAAHGPLQPSEMFSFFTEVPDYVFPVIVHNGMSEQIGNVEVSGTIRGTSGELLGSAYQVAGSPRFLLPGSFAIMYVGLSQPVDPATVSGFWDGRVFEGLVAYTRGEGSSFYTQGENVIFVTEAERTPDGSIVGIVSNQSTEIIYSASVFAVCWNETGAIEGSAESDVSNDRLPAGQMASFSIPTGEFSCSRFLVTVGEDPFFG